MESGRSRLVSSLCSCTCIFWLTVCISGNANIYSIASNILTLQLSLGDIFTLDQVHRVAVLEVRPWVYIADAHFSIYTDPVLKTLITYVGLLSIFWVTWIFVQACGQRLSLCFQILTSKSAHIISKIFATVGILVWVIACRISLFDPFAPSVIFLMTTALAVFITLLRFDKVKEDLPLMVQIQFASKSSLIAIVAAVALGLGARWYLSTPSLPVDQMVALASSDLVGDDKSSLRFVDGWFLSDQIKKAGDPGLRAVERGLESEDPKIREWSCWFLGGTRDSRAIPRLIQMNGKEGAKLARAAAMALRFQSSNG